MSRFWWSSRKQIFSFSPKNFSSKNLQKSTTKCCIFVYFEQCSGGHWPLRTRPYWNWGYFCIIRLFGTMNSVRKGMAPTAPSKKKEHHITRAIDGSSLTALENWGKETWSIHTPPLLFDSVRVFGIFSLIDLSYLFHREGGHSFLFPRSTFFSRRQKIHQFTFYASSTNVYAALGLLIRGYFY